MSEIKNVAIQKMLESYEEIRKLIEEYELLLKQPFDFEFQVSKAFEFLFRIQKTLLEIICETQIIIMTSDPSISPSILDYLKGVREVKRNE